MTMKDKIYKLRTGAKLSQEQFADMFGVSRQSVQRWENGTSVPELAKLSEMARRFDLSLDYLILDRDRRYVEDMDYRKTFKPKWEHMHDWEFYASDLMTEYTQSIEEGLDIESYKDVFESIAALPKGDVKKRMADILFEVVSDAGMREGYKYVEPSELDAIRALRTPYPIAAEVDSSKLESKIAGAWMGRICGCMLGKTVECIKTNELIPFLKETGNYPMHRYIYRSDVTEETLKKYSYEFATRDYADKINGMPIDDDTNYMVLAQKIIELYGRDFTPRDVARAWVDLQTKNAYCTAERVAYMNFMKGYEPPQSAVYKNPYREWIGAQIRGDYYGYINPGNPEFAAEMAWRDASISHVKNGIYGEMFVTAMIAVAAQTSVPEEIIRGGLGQIPHTSRLYEDVSSVLDGYKRGVSQKACFDAIHKKYDEYTGHGWTHTISNAMIVAAALLYGGGDYAKSICMAVETGFDTDCNGATVGSILGMANGIESIPSYWTEPMHDTLYNMIFQSETVKISDCIKKTLSHIR